MADYSFSSAPSLLTILAALLTHLLVHRSKTKIQGDTGLAVLAAALALSTAALQTFTAQHALESLRTAARFIALYLGAASASVACYRASPAHPLAAYPGPALNKITDLCTAWHAYRGTRHLYLARLHARYGPFLRVGPGTLSINDRAAVAPIYRAAACLDKSAAYDLHMPGEGLFFIRSRAAHAARKKLWSKAFTPAALEEYHRVTFPLTRAFGACVAKRAAHGAAFDLGELLTYWSFDVMGKLTFGSSSDFNMLAHGDPLGIAQDAKMTLVAFEFLGYIPWAFDVLRHFDFLQFRRCELFSAAQARKRKNFPENQIRDIFSYLLSAVGEHGETLSDDDLSVDSQLAIIAGSDTVGTMLTLVLFLLLTSPAEHAALRAELDAAFPDPADIFDIAALGALPRLHAVVQEGLRLGSPFGALPRVVGAGGLALGPGAHVVPPGTVVGVPVWAQHTHPQNFHPHPHEYRPARWLPGAEPGADARCDADAVMSFGFGAFGCIGARLAHQQLRLLVAVLTRCFDVAPAPGFDAAAFAAGVRNCRATVLLRALEVVATPRAGAAACFRGVGE